jgi:hypothetical protein
MGFVSEIKKGENLAHPQASPRWMIFAVIAVVILGLVVMTGLWILGKGAVVVQNVPVLGNVTAPARVYAS